MNYRFRRLLGHFFRRFFDTELNSGLGDLRLGVGGFLGLLTIPGVFFSVFLLDKYSSFPRWLRGIRNFDPHIESLPEKCFFLAFTMAVTGIVTALRWDSLMPDRRDFANLAPLPIPLRDVLFAKGLGLLGFVLLFVLALNAGSTLLFPPIVLAEESTVAVALRFMASHAAAMLAASLFVFFALLSIAGLLMCLLPERLFRRVSLAVQFAVALLLIGSVFISPEIPALVKQFRGGVDNPAPYLPLVWFLGLYEQWNGRADALLSTMAARAVSACAIAGVTAVLAYLLSYHLHFRRIPERLAPPARQPVWFPWLVRRSGIYDAELLLFLVRTLFRSPVHSMLFAGYAGAGLALALRELIMLWLGGAKAWSEPSAPALSIPLTLAFFLLSGLRFAYGIPAELGANWLFRASGANGERGVRTARLLMLAGVMPIVAGSIVTFSLLWGATAAILHGAYFLVLILFLTEALLWRFRSIPFTCSFTPGKGNVTFRLAAFFISFMAFAWAMADLELSILRQPLRVIPLAILAAVAAFWMQRYRKDAGQSKEAAFEDTAEPAVQGLNLGV